MPQTSISSQYLKGSLNIMVFLSQKCQQLAQHGKSIPKALITALRNCNEFSTVIEKLVNLIRVSIHSQLLTLNCRVI